MTDFTLSSNDETLYLTPNTSEAEKYASGNFGAFGGKYPFPLSDSDVLCSILCELGFTFSLSVE